MNTRRRITGVVKSNKMDKTVIVKISRTYQHRLYKKTVKSQRTLMAHDELGCEVGDTVRIVESKPMSRHKRFVVQEILHRDVHASALALDLEAEA